MEKRIESEGGYRVVVGAGGGGGGKGRKTQPVATAQSPTETPNTLRSRDDAVILFLLGEGVIDGPINGDLLASTYFDETPIKNADGSLNFQNVILDYRAGEQWQSYIPGMASSVESEKQVGVQIKAATGAVTRTVNNPNANAIRVRLLFPSLISQDDKGNVNGSEVEFKVELSTQGGGFIEVVRDKASGKTTSSYQRNYRFGVSTLGPWSVRITRITSDAANTRTQNDLYWQSYTEIIDLKLRYPNSALLGVRVSAEQFRNLPRVSVKLRGKRILVPHNYDPNARTYSGIFNGTLVLKYSNNPAWTFYDLLSSERYGVGEYVDRSQIDIFALYSIGQYCDELVPNGLGGYEPRFVCNLYLQDAAEAFAVLEAIASCFRGMIYDSANAITAVQDRPTAPVRIYTKANVICEYDESGKLISPPFNYSGSGLDARYTVALITYSDPTDFYRTKIEVVEDVDAINRYGYNPTEKVAVGCTSRAQAYRLGKWLILSQRELTQTINFKVGAEGLLINPGEVFKVIDPLKTFNRRGGRIKATGTTTSIVVLDDSVTLEAGKIYSLSIVLSNGTTESRTVVNSPGTYQQLNVSNLYSETPRHIWILESNDLQAQLFRCVSVSEVDTHQYEIIGVEYNASIYGAIESENFKLEEIPISGLPFPKDAPQSPSGISLAESLYQNIGSGGVRTKVDITWQASTSTFVREYQVEYRTEFATDFRVLEVTQNLSTTLFDVAPGVYIFRIKAINNYGISSVYVEKLAEIYGLNLPPANVTGFTINSINNMAMLTWDTTPDLDVRVGGYFKIKYTPKTIDISWADGIELGTVPGNATSFQTPLLDGTYLIKAIDTSSNQSRNTSQIINLGVVNLEKYNAVATSTQSPNFLGDKFNTTVVDKKIRLTSTDYFDSQTGLFDNQPDMFDSFAGYFDALAGLFDSKSDNFDDAGALSGVLPNGFYEFNAPIELGDLYTSRVRADITAYSVNESQFFDRTGGLFDAMTSNFDGQGNDECVAEMQIATSQDGINFNPFQKFYIGDYLAKSLKFRVVLKSSNPSYNIYVDQLAVTVDMPDRVASGNFTTVDSANTLNYFENAFQVAPQISVTMLNGVGGDYLEVINVTSSFIEVNVRNSTIGNNRIIRNCSYVAKGYGKKL